MENQIFPEKKSSEVIVVTSGKGGVGKTTTSAPAVQMPDRLVWA